MTHIINTTTTEPMRFTFALGMDLRILIKDGHPMFIASDVAKALGYRDAANMARNLDDDEKGTHLVSTPHGQQPMLIIDQSGLFNAVLKSTKAEAKAYRKWVTGTVLPSVHRQGAYVTGIEALPQAQQDALYRVFQAQVKEALRRHDKLTEHDHYASPRKQQERSLRASEAIARDMGLPLDVVKAIAAQGADKGLQTLTQSQ
jgi:prophage antirepressor-like protein